MEEGERPPSTTFLHCTLLSALDKGERKTENEKKAEYLCERKREGEHAASCPLT